MGAPVAKDKGNPHGCNSNSSSRADSNLDDSNGEGLLPPPLPSWFLPSQFFATECAAAAAAAAAAAVAAASSPRPDFLSVWPSRTLQDPSGPYKALKDLIRPVRALQGPRGSYKTLKGLIRLLRVL